MSLNDVSVVRNAEGSYETIPFETKYGALTAFDFIIRHTYINSNVSFQLLVQPVL